MKWFKKLQGNDSSKFQLFCFPHAGGSVDSFKHWIKDLPSWVELQVLQLPGRNARFGEPLVDDMVVVIEEVTKEIIPLIQRPYAFLGHSLGGAISFELARNFRRLDFSGPSYLFIVGREGPRMSPVIRHNFSDSDMINYLKSQEGTHTSIYENQDLMQLLLPVLRNDLKLSESYIKFYRTEAPLSCSIIALWGTRETDLTKERVYDWAKETSARFDEIQFPGNHFFLHQQTAVVLKRILKYITPSIKNPETVS